MKQSEKYKSRALAQAQKKLEQAEAERDRLKAAIKRHHSQVLKDNWGADDELWDVLNLHPRPETKAAA